jgi:serine/threonine protein kinase
LLPCLPGCLLLLLPLIDFGLSKHLESVATLGDGTPDYMPPEMTCSGPRPTMNVSHIAALLAWLHACLLGAPAVSVQLIDFGLSKHLESVATLGVGTPDYVPLELQSTARAASCDVTAHFEIHKLDSTPLQLNL